jgi:uncharacterized protein with von Willebrand factor type A (vWA) domain
MVRPPEHVLAAAAVALGRALRERGLRTCPDDETAVCRALEHLDLRRREHVYWAARSCFVRSRDELPGFEAVFTLFWDGYGLDGPEAPVAEHGESDPRMPGPHHGGDSLPQFRPESRPARLIGDTSAHSSRALDRLPAAVGQEPGRGRRRGVFAAYSPEEVLSDTDELEYARDELAAVRRLAEELRANAPERLSRRLRASRRRGRLDLRASVRRSLAHDGELLAPAFATRSRKPRRLVLLCDVSGSMERYSRALLASLHAAVGAEIKAEAFVFATRLTRLTGPLGGRDAARALEHARACVSDWSGGTRIGQVLAEFNDRYGRLGLARGAIVVIASDGWDRGDPELLGRELVRLRLQSRRLVWLSPRAEELGGQPLALGLQVARPLVDDFVPGHDPRAAAELARLLGGLGAGRPSRRQSALRLQAR